MTDNAGLLYAWLVAKDEAKALRGMPLSVVHDSTGLTEYQIIEAAQELVASGLIRFIGPSGSVPQLELIDGGLA